MAGRVLVVDDDPPICHVLGRLFRAEGWEVAAAPDIAAALALLQSSPGYLVVDLELPDGDGEVVIRAALETDVSPCVVVCTGVVDPERLCAVRALGPRAVLSKPVDFAEILKAFNN